MLKEIYCQQDRGQFRVNTRRCILMYRYSVDVIRKVGSVHNLKDGPVPVIVILPPSARILWNYFLYRA